MSRACIYARAFVGGGISLDSVKQNLKISSDFFKAFVKWLLLAVLVGIVGGIIGSIFHICVDFVTELRIHHKYILFLLPVGGVAIAALYLLAKGKGKIDTNRVIDSARGDGDIPLIMLPLIFISTVITHLVGGSAGREGAALQLGGSIGYNIGKIFRLDRDKMSILVMSGMSAVFAALFGTPLTAAVFSLEVASIGNLRYGGLLPCIAAAIAGYQVSLRFGISPVRFDGLSFPTFGAGDAVRVIILTLLCALVGILFCTAIKKCEHFTEKLLPNKFARAAVGGAVILLLTLVLGTPDYTGAGMDVITRAFGGEARPEAFLLKILFTAITISAGFKGGEIVPTFFIGATFGCFAGTLLGLDSGFGAAIGFISLFCSVVNCPLASLLLSVEVFSGEGILFYAIVCSMSFMMSGYSSLYNSQRFVYSKLDASYIDNNNEENTNE